MNKGKAKMDYKNLFIDKSEEELKILYEQYEEWCVSGVLGETELGLIRDQYYEMGLNAPLIVIERDRLKAIAVKWYSNNS